MIWILPSEQLILFLVIVGGSSWIYIDNEINHVLNIMTLLCLNIKYNHG